MTAISQPPSSGHEPHDPYKMRSLEQILSLFDGGEFLAGVLADNTQLQRDLLDHAETHGPKGCKGSMTIKVSYTVGTNGDVTMSAVADFVHPKKPPSSAAAFVNDQGELTLYSPMMRQMHGAPRDISSFDPDTGEIRDPS